MSWRGIRNGPPVPPLCDISTRLSSTMYGASTQKRTAGPIAGGVSSHVPIRRRQGRRLLQLRRLPGLSRSRLTTRGPPIARRTQQRRRRVGLIAPPTPGGLVGASRGVRVGVGVGVGGSHACTKMS